MGVDALARSTDHLRRNRRIQEGYRTDVLRYAAPYTLTCRSGLCSLRHQTVRRPELLPVPSYQHRLVPGTGRNRSGVLDLSDSTRTANGTSHSANRLVLT